MATDKTRKITYELDKTTQEVDLKKLLGRTPTASEKEKFVAEAIERIIERSQSGQDILGNRFKSYSKDYAEQKGVSRNSVDMTLDGDMLLAIRRLRDADSKLRFGITGGVDAKKSFNHNTGDTLPKRRFFGLTVAEQKEIASSIKAQDIRGVTAREVREDTRESLLSLVETLRLEADNGN